MNGKLLKTRLNSGSLTQGEISVGGCGLPPVSVPAGQIC